MRLRTQSSTNALRHAVAAYILGTLTACQLAVPFQAHFVLGLDRSPVMLAATVPAPQPTAPADLSGASGGYESSSPSRSSGDGSRARSPVLVGSFATLYRLQAVVAEGAQDAIDGVAALDDGRLVYASAAGNGLWTAETSSMRPQLLAGLPTFPAGFMGDNVPATTTTLNGPRGLTYDPGTDLVFVADAGNGRIRYFTPGGRLYTAAGGGANSGADVPQALNAKLNTPSAVAIGRGGTVFIVESGVSRLRALSQSGRLNTLVDRPGEAMTAVAASWTASHVWYGAAGRIEVAISDTPAIPPRLVHDFGDARVEGLAYDQAGLLFALVSTAGASGARVYQLPLDAEGGLAPATTPLAIAGAEGTVEFAPAPASSPAARTFSLDARGSALTCEMRGSATGWAATGRLLVGHGYHAADGTARVQLLALAPAYESETP